MTFPERTLLYLTRKKGKTLVLFLLLFTVSAFVLACFSLLYATGGVATNMRMAVGAAFHIRPAQAQGVITGQAVQQVMAGDKLKHYNGRNSAYAKGLAFMPGAYHTDESNMGQVSANHYTALHPHFQDKLLALAEGRHITPSDEQVVIISETLAALNGLSVGDRIALSPAELAEQDGVFMDALKDNPTKATAQIIGIFKEIEPQADAAYQPTAGLRANMIFSDHALVAALGLAKAGEYTGGVSFYMQDPLYLDAVVEEVKQMDAIDWNSFFIRKDDFHYEKISAGLLTIQNLIKTLLVCVTAVSVAVLMLLLAMRMRGRIHEAGILLSVGIPKKEILGQFIAEVAVTAMVAFACAYFAAGYISGRVESSILNHLQVVQIEEQALQIGLIMPPLITALIFACLVVVVVTSALLSSLPIIQLKPRAIFAQMS
ncbi:MAG: ABC transporter permease [Oscillospiraceae bacterium]|jgi:ABC-type lipoprotein release transport system permease subunit|nr:ABC transporter permease [Oscillospiraceae bacterium]